MIMLDKARASIFIKIIAVVIAISFVLSLMPFVGGAAISEFFKSIFVSSEQPTQEQEIAKLKSVIKKEPKNVKAHVDLGNLYFDGQNYEKAIEYYDLALKLNPEDIDVMVDMGTSHFRLDDPDKALEVFRRAVAVDPEHAMAWYNMGVVFKEQGDTVNVQFAWSRYLELEPTGEQAEQVRQELTQLQQ